MTERISPSRFHEHGWRVRSRVLARGFPRIGASGLVLFTTPSYEWASWFRSTLRSSVAEFETSSGSHVDVPSIVYDASCQVDLIESAGLVVKDVVSIPASRLVGALSPKLPRDANAATGYVAFRP